MLGALASSRRRLVPTRTARCTASACGAGYGIECYIDRTGGDATTGASPAYVISLEACVAACDRTSECEDALWVPGNQGPCLRCLKKVESPVSKIDVWGAVKRSECTMTTVKARR